MNKTVSDQAIHLDLVAKAQGIDAAESYFIDLPETSKNHLTYGALFNCYCKELMTEKAEALMEKMKELNLGLTSMHYNSLMTLYTKIDQPEKIPAIIQEMRSEYVMPDSYTNLASIYADASLFEKAENALKELEKKNAHQDLSVYQFLITLYGCTGNLLEVYRIWRSLRLAFRKTSNISYLNMIQALVNLKDLPGAEKCFREWESGCSTYDIRIANVLIGAYAQKGFLEKAEEMKERARRRGAKSNAKTWELFLDYHLKDGNFKLAVDCIANAISTGRGNGGKWVPSLGVIKTMMTHFEQEKDVDGAEGFLEILKKAVENLDAEVFESLIRTYAAAGRTSTMMHRRLKTEKVEVNEASKKLLEAICVE
ncbi:hypothetical protein HS088_TW06G00747 [Tripterygium wilfordii]|uniref:Pentatricopeptide repeat-containing protein n=1 Tax=Tripterygium wilfordii TaxID=458696 RepID=A0A7J7DKH7_TRIWF|nr:hypothetical protein HS088_TW06G00747 [Tripterygium wilfordii]